MPQKIVIDPVTRLEGHAKITIHLDDKGTVEDAFFHITQFRGFEKLCEGRPFFEMPSLMARICGICPVSHLVASAKACDDLLAVQIPRTADMLRRILNLAQMIQSHALSFFYLSSPDMLLGMDSDPAKRNIFGVLQSNPELARDGVRLRKFGQQIIELLGGKRVHPAWVVPGGVSKPLTREERDQILAWMPECLVIIERVLGWYKKALVNYRDEISNLGNFSSLFMGLVREDGRIAFYEGKLRIMDEDGKILGDQIPASDYPKIIEEAVEPWTYLKFPYYKPMGYPGGMYRVGPLARMMVADRCGSPRADEEHAIFKKMAKQDRLSSFHYHYARLIEILFGLERLNEILRDPEILSDHVRSVAEPNRREGIGMAEAPRGTLIHHYKIDDNGLMKWANLIIATGHNNLAMNRSVKEVAKHYIKSPKLTEGMLNRVEAVIRTYDPCLSCSTHAAGRMPMQVRLVGPDRKVLDEIIRS